MKTLNRSTGRAGEEIAARTLQEKGFTILKRNFSNRFGEIDIIAQDRDTLVFVEVKAKTGIEYGLPEEMISPGKLARIRNMATLYMNGQLLPCRIDVVAIVLGENNEVLRLTHYENVV
ncbi:MAG: YraN family protein [Candidatus Gottesmanbacteria bacterium]|nr:YraN family protein [Candidatus Gottesmanbacteria bacterium]